MKTYIVILRGINVSGKNKLPMQELRVMLEGLEFSEVKTYIQSGNIVLKSSKEALEVEKTIKKGISKTFGYDVPVLARTVTQWEKAIANNPYSEVEEKQQYFTFLSAIPEIKYFDIDAKEDTYQIIEDVAYVNAVGGYGKTKLTNNLFEKKLNVTATTRNLKTTLKLLSLVN
ncbi:DUF1697 domain-containing protein [Tenacibaculum jejuense]|uniref:DUF1697 domain-containing protein n=1 Tax=Tenacibaculum jejuense TaxID=584609 RepID=A0A238U9P7_9FLAO|nr:DUF1697 domain-containing protein [Tenacibaculum jejuense]SNR15140.1 conserved protein of unknown function [Tenacibaculum jejuense]